MTTIIICTCIQIWSEKNANSITSCSKFLWQPTQVNPALENTRSTEVNDAGMQSRFMA